MFRTSRFLLAIGISLTLFTSACTKKSGDPSNTLYTYSIAKIKGLDPAFADDLYGGTETMRVHDTLLQYHYLKRPYQLEPSLAESLPEISKDGKTFTFKIKKGILFQDDDAFTKSNGKGRELVAEDLIYSWKRVADPKLNSPMWWIFDGKVVGLNEWRKEQSGKEKSDYDAPVAGLKALDSHTLQVQLVTRSYQFLYYIAMPAASAVAREAVEKYGAEFLNHPVGTGAFRVSEYNPSSKIVYVKNPTYRKEYYPTEGAPGDREAGLLEDAGKQLPLVDKIVMTVHTESQPQWLNFMKGELDYSSIPKDSFDQALDKDKKLRPEVSDKGIRLVIDPWLDITHLTFNMHDSVMAKNKELRQALSLALDYEKMIEIFYNNRAISAQSSIPPGLQGYDPNFKNPYKTHDLAKAKELLKKAGYPDGKGLGPIEFLTQSDTTSRQFTDFYQKSFADIGVTLKVQQYSWPELQASIKNKKGQMWNYAWGADYPDSENFLQLFYSKNSSPGPNDANYSNAEFDKLYEKSLTLPDGAERTALYQKMSAIVVEDTPWIFGVHRLTYTLLQKWMRNYKYSEFLGMSKYYRVESSLRK